MTPHSANPNPVQLYINEHYAHKGGATGFAKDAGVAYQSVHKTTLGLYSSIPTNLAAHMARTSDYTQEEWQKRYSLWVDKELDILINDIKSGALEAEAFFVPSSNLENTYPTFSAWREALSYSQIDFCKTFLMHQAILQKYEAGNMKNLPKSLEDRIKKILFAIFDIDELSVARYIKAVKNLPRKKEIA
jgi:hypothetical protein